jgi:hypothetical protein
LRRQGDAMRPTHLRAVRGNGPDGFIKVEFFPSGETQFSWPREGQGEKLQGGADFRRSIIVIYCAQ